MKKIILLVFLCGMEIGYVQGSGESYNDVNTLNQQGQCPNCDLINLKSTELTPGLKITDLSGAHLANANLSGWDLSGATLINADLTGAVLSGCNLTNANLTGANLSGTDLSNVNAGNANFSNTSLYSADLSNGYFNSAIFTGAGFGGATLDGANFTYANLTDLETVMDQAKTFVNSKKQTVTIQAQSYLDLRGQTLNNVSFTGAKLAGINLSSCILNNVGFSQADLSGNADLSNINSSSLPGINNVNLKKPAFDISNANLQNANLTGVNFQNISFNGTDFTNANLSNVDLTSIYLPGLNVKVTGVNFSGANFQDIRVDGLDLTGCNFTKANLSGVSMQKYPKLSNINFSGANLSGITITAGTIDSCVFDNANLTGSTFIVMNFTNSSFQTVNLQGSAGFIANSSNVKNTNTNIPAESTLTLNNLDDDNLLGSLSGGPAMGTPLAKLFNAAVVGKTAAPFPLNTLLGMSGMYTLTFNNVSYWGNTKEKSNHYFYVFALWTPANNNLNNFYNLMLDAANVSPAISGQGINIKSSVSGTAVANPTTQPTCFTPQSIYNTVQKYGLMVSISYFNPSKKPANACSC